MKKKLRYFGPKPLIFVSSVWLIACAFAQTNGPTDVSASPLPATKSEFWTYAIAFITPLIVGGFKKLIPAIPKWLLPVSTPLVGLLLGAGLKALGAAEMGWVDMAQAGAMAVFIRESFNKLVTTPLKGEEEAKTKDPEDLPPHR